MEQAVEAVETTEAKPMARTREQYVQRFSLSQRMEHLAIMITFTGLALTGLPQKYAGAGISQWLIVNMGGIELIRYIHRILGYMFTAGAVYHLGAIILSIAHRSFKPTIFFSFQDFRDAVGVLRYDLGITDVHPKFDRFDFRQKFEYWGIVFGGVIMLISGYFLMFPVFFTQLLPGQAIPVAKVFHSYEGLMAFLVIVIWHLYGAHLEPEKFPGDTTIFTGKISRERMLKEHALEYHRLAKEEREREMEKERQEKALAEKKRELPMPFVKEQHEV